MADLFEVIHPRDRFKDAASGGDDVLQSIRRKWVELGDGSYGPQVASLMSSAMQEIGLTELIGVDEQVDQDDYGASVGVSFGENRSGEFLSFMFYSTEDGTGAVQEPAGTLLILDADPAIAAGDTSMTAAERVTVLGQVEVAAADWKSDANGASAFIYNRPVPFHSLSSVYFVWFHEDATSFNDGAGDDEQLEFNAWYRRDS